MNAQEVKELFEKYLEPKESVEVDGCDDSFVAYFSRAICPDLNWHCMVPQAFVGADLELANFDMAKKIVHNSRKRIDAEVLSGGGAAFFLRQHKSAIEAAVAEAVDVERDRCYQIAKLYGSKQNGMVQWIRGESAETITQVCANAIAAAICDDSSTLPDPTFRGMKMQFVDKLDADDALPDPDVHIGGEG